MTARWEDRTCAENPSAWDIAASPPDHYLGNGVTLTGEQVHYGTRCANRHATDPGEALMFLNMLGLADDYERPGRKKAKERRRRIPVVGA